MLKKNASNRLIRRTLLLSSRLTVKAFNELWCHASGSNMILPQDPTQCSHGNHCVDAMHADTASDIDDIKSAADSNNMTMDDATLFVKVKASGLPTLLKGS
eukprot:6184819-Pleurochrysis_carterae.AAC.1